MQRLQVPPCLDPCCATTYRSKSQDRRQGVVSDDATPVSGRLVPVTRQCESVMHNTPKSVHYSARQAALSIPNSGSGSGLGSPFAKFAGLPRDPFAKNFSRFFSPRVSPTQYPPAAHRQDRQRRSAPPAHGARHASRGEQTRPLSGACASWSCSRWGSCQAPRRGDGTARPPNCRHARW